MHRSRWLAFAGFALVVLVAPSLLFAQADSGVVVDKTGPFGAAIDYYYPVVVTFLQSLVVKLLAKVSPGFRKLNMAIQWGALFVVGLVAYRVAAATGFALTNADAHTWTVTGVLSAIGMTVSGLIYRFGGHKVQALEPSPVP